MGLLVWSTALKMRRTRKIDKLTRLTQAAVIKEFVRMKKSTARFLKGLFWGVVGSILVSILLNKIYYGAWQFHLVFFLILVAMSFFAAYFGAFRISSDKHIEKK